jgi:hypothetical protein
MTDLQILGIFAASVLASAGYLWLCERLSR